MFVQWLEEVSMLRHELSMPVCWELLWHCCLRSPISNEDDAWKLLRLFRGRFKVFCRGKYSMLLLFFLFSGEQLSVVSAVNMLCILVGRPETGERIRTRSQRRCVCSAISGFPTIMSKCDQLVCTFLLVSLMSCRVVVLTDLSDILPHHGHYSFKAGHWGCFLK